MAGDWGSEADYHPNDCSCPKCKSNEEFYKRHPNCFPFRTLIDTPSGQVKIGELVEGQLVLSYDAGTLVPRIITQKRVLGPTQIIRVEFSSGHKLFATNHHTFLTEQGWKKLSCFRPGDVIVRADGLKPVVTRLVAQKEEFVFNIYTAGEHNFIADGFVAHNFTVLRGLRTALHRLLVDPKHRTQMVLR